MKSVLLAVVLIASLTPSIAAANVGALQVNVGGNLEPGMRRSVGNALHRATEASAHRLVPEAEMRAEMPGSSLDCFTAACLMAVADATRADGGLRIQFNGRAEIYDWTVEIYDLRGGKVTATETGKCELCGVTEVEQEVEASISKALQRAKFTPRPASEPQPKQQPQQPVAQPTTQPARSSEGEVSEVTIEVSVTPSDATITFRDSVVGTGDASIRVAPGTYEFAFAREGYGGLRETITISPNSAGHAMLRVHLSKTDPDAVYIEPDGPMDRLGNAKKTYGVIGLASGAVLVGVGAWLNAIDGRPTCGGHVTTCPRIRETSAAAFGTTLAGGVLLAGGVTFLLWDALSGRNEPSQARVAPLVGEDVVGVGVFGRF